MGFFFFFLALILGMIMAFFSSGTSKKPYEPKTEEVNGVIYKNCFLPEYVEYGGPSVSGDEPICYIPNEDEYWFGPQKGWYKITDSIIARGYQVNSGLEATGNRVYCRESDWDELKEFYGNMENYIFFIGTSYDINGKKQADCEIDSELVDPVLWDKLMQFAHDSYYERGTGKNKAVELPLDRKSYNIDFYLTMENVDGLFSASSHNLCEYKGEFYMERTYVEGHYQEAFKIPEELQGYIRELAEHYDNAVYHFNQ